MPRVYNGSVVFIRSRTGHTFDDSLLLLCIRIRSKDNHPWLRNEVQRSIETTLTVHVLAVLALQYDVNLADIVPFHLFAFGRVKPTEAHGFQHLLLFGCFAFKLGFRYHGFQLCRTP